MRIECDRLAAAHAVILKKGFTKTTREELFHAAHDIKGDAATFGYPTAAAAAESLCRIIEHAPDLTKVPGDLIAHHINAIVGHRARTFRSDKIETANELSRRLRGVADEFLTIVNRDRPEHLEAILAPSIVRRISAKLVRSSQRHCERSEAIQEHPARLRLLRSQDARSQ